MAEIDKSFEIMNRTLNLTNKHEMTTYDTIGIHSIDNQKLDTFDT